MRCLQNTVDYTVGKTCLYKCYIAQNRASKWIRIKFESGEYIKGHQANLIMVYINEVDLKAYSA